MVIECTFKTTGGNTVVWKALPATQPLVFFDLGTLEEPQAPMPIPYPSDIAYGKP